MLPSAGRRRDDTVSETAPAGLRLFKEGGLYTLGMLVMRAGNFLLLPLYTALLTTEEYGAYSVVVRGVGLLVPLAILGQGHSILRLVVDADQGRDRDRLLGTVIGWVGLASGILVALAALLWPYLDRWIEGVPLWPLGAAGLAIVTGQGLFNITLVWMQGQHQAALHTKLSILRWFVLLAGVGVFVVGLRWGAAGILLSIACSFAVVSFLGLRTVLEGRMPRIHLPVLKETLGYGIPFVPHALATIALVATDQILLAAHEDYGLSAAGVYALGANLASGVFMLAVGMQKAWVPFFMESDRDRDKVGWGPARRLSFFSVSVVACGAVGMGLLAPEAVSIASLFSGTDWSAAARVVPVLAIGALARSYYLVGVTVIMANKKVARAVLLVSLPALVLNYLLNSMWIPEWGIDGAAWATTVSWLVTAVGAAFVSRFARKVPFKYVRAVILMALVVATLYLGWGRSLPTRIGLGLTFAAALFALDRKDLVKAAKTVLAKRGSA